MKDIHKRIQKISRRNKYYKTEKTKKKYRLTQWKFIKIFKHDRKWKHGLKHYRVKWSPVLYSRRHLKKRKFRKELSYWKYDIKRESSDGEGGLFVEWKDSYVPLEDISADELDVGGSETEEEEEFESDSDEQEY